MHTGPLGDLRKCTKKTRQLTLLWLTFPVHKVDNVTGLQHVSLLLDQLGHVDHRAVRATHTNTHTHTDESLHNARFALSSHPLFLQESNGERIFQLCAAVVIAASD